MRKLSPILTLAFTFAALAVGPKVPCILTFAPSPDASVQGYWLYFRSTSGSYNDQQRWAMPTNAATGYDLRTIGLPKGIYWISASATNADTESDLATEIQWRYQNPNKPGNLAVSPPAP